ncbi:right-handed parallel beta-helix repeat-containing protein [Sphingobium sufflavum]|uniref:calcium-binding protein n=1 Tax=Sphingobium sufflavum TaxID=1129547 RepID=UPI001F3737F3|nr:right-handed parallel beta-helix repeat-containing protein [Sphingobium sufflavum]MCE7798306.1 right-handed parallel beta-helix repeat-containing protein [Sphingobium sufflavum]
MTTFSVSNDVQLAAAIAKATGGDTILLASGTYAKITITNKDYSSAVTITSANPSDPAIVKNIAVKGSTNLVFSNLDLPASEAQGSSNFLVLNSANVAFDHVNVHGTDKGISDVSPFMLRGSTNVSVTNSEFSNVQHGISFLDNDGMTLTGNSFHDLRTDGIRGGGTSNVMISKNVFTDFYPEAGDHPDAIQFWTTNTTASASNITISDNMFVQGKGEQVQGVFMRDTFDTLPYQNVTITGNTIIGGMNNGVSVDGVNGLTLSDNTVIALGDEKSTIRVENATNATVSNNQATDYVYINSDTAVREGNILLDRIGKAMAASILPSVSGAAASSAVVKEVIELVGKLNHEIGYYDAPVGQLVGRNFAEIVVNGTAGDDRLNASSIGASRLEGGAGNDVLNGNGLFEHRLIGGAGDDSYYVRGTGDHVIEAENGGNDTVVSYINYTLTANVENLRMATGGLTGIGNELDNKLTGSVGDDILYGLDGNDLIKGGEGNDWIYGGDGNDDLRGDDGDDYLDGGDGNDMLLGGAGNDILIGGAGNDVLEGGLGSDIMTGGAGNDIFRFRVAEKGVVDIITDFTRGQDKIDLNAIDAKIATTANEAFTFIATNAFHNVAGELRYEVANGNATIMGDVDGDGVADFIITARGVTTLTASDFAL